MRAGLVGWLGCGAVCVAALVIARLSPRLETAPEASFDVQKRVFYTLASEEASMRQGAATSFPTDPWSQDDDFHNRELRRLQGLALGESSVSANLRAVDDGARERWPRPLESTLEQTVPPCRPRPIY